MPNRTTLNLNGATHSSYQFDAVNRLTQLADEASQNFTFGYDVTNKLKTKTLPNNIVTSYDYDGMERLTRLKHQGTSTVTDNSYAYNPANQISNIAGLSQTKTFGYDNIDRLTNVTGSASESDIFDSVGNRTSSSQSASYTYQANNRLTSSATGGYSYNANGTMTSSFENGKGLWRYNWDHENRLVTASTRKQTIRYRYDALGRRISRYIAGGKENTKFTYDGNDVVLDDNFGVITKYQNGLGIDNKLKMVTNGVSKYFLQHHLGSTTALTNSSGSVIESATYDSFGNATGNLSTRYQFTGREFDKDIGLTYYRARWYSSELGRFVSEDPIGFGGKDVNLYGYVWNSPMKFVDPKGTDGETLWLPYVTGGAFFGALKALGGYAAAAAPPVAVAAGGGVLIYGSWHLGEYIARKRFPEQYEDAKPDESCDEKPKSPPITPPIFPPSFPPRTPPEEDPEDNRDGCEEEKKGCAIRCSEAVGDPSLKHFYGGSMTQCMKNCLSERCGGEPKWKGYKSR